MSYHEKSPLACHPERQRSIRGDQPGSVAHVDTERERSMTRRGHFLMPREAAFSGEKTFERIFTGFSRHEIKLLHIQDTGQEANVIGLWVLAAVFQMSDGIATQAAQLGKLAQTEAALLAQDAQMREATCLRGPAF